MKSKEERTEFLKELTPKEQKFFYEHPDLFLFDKQIIPEDQDWMFYLLRCGRGFGKTYSGSAWIAKKIRNGAKIVGLCGPTYDDVSKIMVPAILSWFLPSELDYPAYNHQTHTVKFKNGAKIYCYTSEKEIKGPNLEFLWCDEIATWCDSQSEKIQERFEDITRAVRVGKVPQTIITSTPKSHKFFWDFQDEVDKNNKNYKMTCGTMFDNPFLPQSFIESQIAKYGDSPRGRQELYGDLITENPEAMFRMQWINDNRFVKPHSCQGHSLHLSTPPATHELNDEWVDCQGLPAMAHSLQNAIPVPPPSQDDHIKYFFHKVLINKEINIKEMIISVDTAGSSKKTSDETGIMLVANAFNNEAYVLYDMSGHHTADEWAKIVRNLFYTYHKTFPVRIVAETNFGGETVLTNITALDHNLVPFVEGITASKSKMIRAEVSAAKYQRGKVHHVGYFEKLERQMCNYTGPNSNYSPDRMDALVHALNKLYVVPTADRRLPSFLNGY